MGRSLRSFLRAWIRRVHKRIVVSSASTAPPPPPEVAPLLLDQRATRLSPAQQLPDEIILEIMGHLIPVSQRRSSISASSPERSATAVTQALIRHQLFLLWACKTCRSWYSAGCEVMYASPLLATPRKMELFERTVTQSPSLARFVKAIYAPIRVEGTASDLFGWVVGRRSLAAQREELGTLLSNCSSLRALTLRHSVRKGIVSCVPVTQVLKSKRLSGQLESLSLHGSTHETRSAPQFCVLPGLSDMLLPHLQVLCLRGIYVLPSLRLPELPALHTMHLVGNHYFGQGPYFAGERLPALRALEVVEHKIAETSAGLRELFDEAALQQLEYIRVMQDERCMVVTRSIPFDGTVRRIVLGRLSARDHTDLVCWRFPDALESLSLVLKQGATDHSCVADLRDTLDAVTRCLALNDEAKRMKELAIVAQLDKITGSIEDRTPLKESMDELQNLCDRRGILFRIDEPTSDDLDDNSPNVC